MMAFLQNLQAYPMLRLKMPFIPSELLATAVLWPKQILRMLFKSFLFNPKITTFWGFVGEDFIIMIAVCRWVVQALAKRLNIFFCHRMDCPKEIAYRSHFAPAG